MRLLLVEGNRDFFLDAPGAKDYGIVDEVIEPLTQ